MDYKILSIEALFIFLFGSCGFHSADDCKWQPLFNGKDLTGWDTYLGPRYDSVLKKRDTIPIGFNNDPYKVFEVANIDGEKVIRISGEQFGGISTRGEYKNYHLQLQFRWGQLKWPPRKAGKRDSGLMYHAVGPQGADGGYWMRSQEFQIEEGDCGDYWGCAGAIFDIRAKKEKADSYVYSNDGDMLTFSTGSSNGRHCKKYPDAEKPSGVWNTIDLYCFGSTSVHVVNGVVNMILYNSRQFEGGTEIPLTEGKIQIESEGAEIYFRNIQICSINKLPDNLIKEQQKVK
jgi:hypothetical protein